MACSNGGLAAASGAHLPPDLRKRIEIMAEHIARNGPEFELTVKQKNEHNPQFAFLFGTGEGTEYYSQVLATNRANMVSGGASPQGLVPGASPAARGSVGVALAGSAQSQSPLASQAAVIPSPDIAELAHRWREPPVYPLQADAEMQLSDLVSSLEQMASVDTIRNGRQWVESNAVLGQQVAGNLMIMMRSLPATSHRLHVLYLVHDVLQTEAARKEPMRPLLRAFKPYLVWMMRPAFQQAVSSGGPDEDVAGKTLRLLQLWVERSIITPDESEEIRKLIVTPDLPATAQQGGPPMPCTTHPKLRPTNAPRPGINFGGATILGAGGRPVLGAKGSAPVVNRPVLGMQPGMRPPLPGVGMQAPRPSAAMGQGSCCRPSMPGMLPPMQGNFPRSHGYRLQVAARSGPLTPETVPVGLMATMVLQVRKLKKTVRADFIPYLPLEANKTPQMMPPLESPTPRLLERVQDFYSDLRDDERSTSSSSSSRSRSRSRSRSPNSPPRLRNSSAATQAAGNGAVNAMGMVAGMQQSQFATPGSMPGSNAPMSTLMSSSNAPLPMLGSSNAPIPLPASNAPMTGNGPGGTPADAASIAAAQQSQADAAVSAAKSTWPMAGLSAMLSHSFSAVPPPLD